MQLSIDKIFSNKVIINNSNQLISYKGFVLGEVLHTRTDDQIDLRLPIVSDRRLVEKQNFWDDLWSNLISIKKSGSSDDQIFFQLEENTYINIGYKTYREFHLRIPKQIPSDNNDRTYHDADGDLIARLQEEDFEDMII